MIQDLQFRDLRFRERYKYQTENKVEKKLKKHKHQVKHVVLCTCPTTTYNMMVRYL